MHRLQRVARHVHASADDLKTPTPQGATLPPRLAAQPTAAVMSGASPGDDDVVICCAVRTAIGKAGKGGFKDTPPEDLLAPLFKAVIDKTKIDPKAIGDTQIGNVLQGGGGAMQA